MQLWQGASHNEGVSFHGVSCLTGSPLQQCTTKVHCLACHVFSWAWMLPTAHGNVQHLAALPCLVSGQPVQGASVEGSASMVCLAWHYSSALSRLSCLQLGLDAPHCSWKCAGPCSTALPLAGQSVQGASVEGSASMVCLAWQAVLWMSFQPHRIRTHSAHLGLQVSAEAAQALLQCLAVLSSAGPGCSPLLMEMCSTLQHCHALSQLSQCRELQWRGQLPWCVLPGRQPTTAVHCPGCLVFSWARVWPAWICAGPCSTALPCFKGCTECS